MLSSWQSIALVLTGIAAYTIFDVVTGLQKNLRIAQATGFPCVIAPWSSWSIPGQTTAKLWKPVVKLLPPSLWENWIDVVLPNWAYEFCYQPFVRLGDIHLVVSPRQITLNTANAELIHQVSARRDDFPKKLETYDILRIFGENVVTTEGTLWRMHRRVTAASFNERNSALVFAEAIRQSKGMLDGWTSRGSATTLRSLEHDTMRLAMHIIGYVGFGLRLLWPGQEMPPGVMDRRWEKYGALKPQAGYTLSFVDAVSGLLDNVILVLLAPHWLLRLLPIAKCRTAMECYDNYKRYMISLLAEKRDEIASGEHIEGMDLIGQLVGASVRDPTAPKGSSPRSLTEPEILGNLFIMLVAGHETSANAIHFALVELAARPSTQRQLQKELDSMFGDSDPSTWNYDTAVNALSASTAGAATNETLRKMPPVVEIPKGVARSKTGESHQIITVDGTQHILPEQVNISIVISAVQRNPRYWPTSPSPVTGKPHDLDDWVPERWIQSGEDRDHGEKGPQPRSDPALSEATADDTEKLGGFHGSDTSASLFRPERGSFIPYSDGPRACLGRRIAQVEIMAALAIVFREHSMELAVDQWASDGEVAAMGREERTALYARAQEQCRKTLLTAGSIITLKLHGENVPVRLVKRGEERFVSWAN